MDFIAYTPNEDEAGYLRESVEILPEAIREEFVRIPADLAYWGERYAEATKEFLLAEHARKVVYARTRLSIKEVAALKGQKLTEGDADAWIETSPEYQASKLAEISAEAAKLAARCRLEAVSAKRDMSMSLGAAIRQEQAQVGVFDRSNR